jgi:hypothetical protein
MREQTIEANRTLLASAKIRSATIVVMQKLTRTANDAQNPTQSIQDMTASCRGSDLA